MKKITLILFAIQVFNLTACKNEEENSTKPFTLKSTELTSVFKAENFGNGFNGCTGENKSPQLTWENAPTGTKGFAITMVDLNAFGENKPFDHWMIIDIPETITSLDKDAGNSSNLKLPKGALHTPNGAFDFDTIHPEYYKSYAGVFPTSGNTNKYEITVYALNVSNLNISSNSSSNKVKEAIKNASISSAKLTLTATR